MFICVINSASEHTFEAKKLAWLTSTNSVYCLFHVHGAVKLVAGKNHRAIWTLKCVIDAIFLKHKYTWEWINTVKYPVSQIYKYFGKIVVGVDSTLVSSAHHFVIITRKPVKHP